MDQVITFHIVDADSRSRAAQARTVYSLGHHAEVYADAQELVERPPRSGVVLVRRGSLGESPRKLFARLEAVGVWLPVIAVARHARVADVVEAVKAGALTFLELPLDADILAETLVRIGPEVEERSRQIQVRMNARARIERLSTRERQVLDLLALGQANKEMARVLDISPRTVEIHRANMMAKLQAGNVSEAIRLLIQSGAQPTVEATALDEMETQVPIRTSMYAPATAVTPELASRKVPGQPERQERYRQKFWPARSR